MCTCVYVKLVGALLHALKCVCVYIDMESGWRMLKLASPAVYALADLISLTLFGSLRELLASPIESSFVSSEKSAE